MHRREEGGERVARAGRGDQFGTLVQQLEENLVPGQAGEEAEGRL